MKGILKMTTNEMEREIITCLNKQSDALRLVSIAVLAKAWHRAIKKLKEIDSLEDDIAFLKGEIEQENEKKVVPIIK